MLKEEDEKDLEKKGEKEKNEEELEDEESELDAKAKSPKESELEEELEEAEEEIKEQQVQKFIPIKGNISAPVLEQIADTSQPPKIDWQLSPQRKEEKEKKQIYQLEEKASEDYETPRQEIGSNPPILRTERIDLSNVQPISTAVGREFNAPKFAESIKSEEYNLVDVPRDFKPGQEKQRIGREYKPKSH